LRGDCLLLIIVTNNDYKDDDAAADGGGEEEEECWYRVMSYNSTFGTSSLITNKWLQILGIHGDIQEQHSLMSKQASSKIGGVVVLAVIIIQF